MLLLPPRILTADRGDAGLRLDLMLRRHLAGMQRATRTRVQTWIENGQVTVNGARIRKTAARTAFGDIVGVELPVDSATAKTVMTGEDTPLEILYEDDQLLAVNKAAGTVVHPSYRNTTGTTINALLWRARSWPREQRPSLVGRLDKGTSGVLLVAKTAAMHAALQRTMASNDAEKQYLALVYGRVTPVRGLIDLRLDRDPSDRRKMIASPTAGAPSLTRFERLAFASARRGGLSLLSCRLATGRTHQIRVHLAARGWPVVGDVTYGEPHWSKIAEPVLADVLRAFPRQALHAWRAAFNHPLTHVRVAIEAPIPDDIAALLATAGLDRNLLRC